MGTHQIKACKKTSNLVELKNAAIHNRRITAYRALYRIEYFGCPVSFGSIRTPLPTKEARNIYYWPLMGRNYNEQIT